MGTSFSKRAAVMAVSAILTISAAVAVSYGIENWPSPPTRVELRAEESCEFEAIENVLLSEGDECAIDALRNRCGDLDSCFVDCFTSGDGVNIGGGCGHICNYNWKVDWEFPPEALQCYKEGGGSFLPF